MSSQKLGKPGPSARPFPFGPIPPLGAGPIAPAVGTAVRAQAQLPADLLQAREVGRGAPGHGIEDLGGGHRICQHDVLTC